MTNTCTLIAFLIICQFIFEVFPVSSYSGKKHQLAGYYIMPHFNFSDEDNGKFLWTMIKTCGGKKSRSEEGKKGPCNNNNHKTHFRIDPVCSVTELCVITYGLSINSNGLLLLLLWQCCWWCSNTAVVLSLNKHYLWTN